MHDETKLEIAGIIFTWDDNKAIANWRKHKVDFKIAAEVLFDEYAVDVYDVDHSVEENRRSIIGRVYDTSLETGILFVVYVERVRDDGREVIRLISARQANRKEVRLYERDLP